jgi:hypothetical protein
LRKDRATQCRRQPGTAIAATIVAANSKRRSRRSHQLADLTKLESSNRATATPEEAKAVVAGSIAYFGTYSVDEASKIVSIDIQASTFANQIGSTADNKRIITSLTANELKLTNPGSASGLKLELVFKRAN